MRRGIPCLLLLCMLASEAWAQGSVVVLEHEAKDEEAINAAETHTDNALAAELDAKGDDELLADQAHGLRAKQAEDPMAKTAQQIDDNLMSLQKALDGGMSSMDIMKDKKLRKQLEQVFSDNPMMKLPREVLKPMLAEQLGKSPLGPLVQRFPKFLDFMVDMMRDKEAFPGLLKLLDRPRALRNCGAASLGLMVGLWLLRKKLITHKTKLFKKIMLRLSMSVLFLCLSTSILFLTFQKELAPSWGIFRKTFF